MASAMPAVSRQPLHRSCLAHRVLPTLSRHLLCSTHGCRACSRAGKVAVCGLKHPQPASLQTQTMQAQRCVALCSTELQAHVFEL